MNSIRLKPQSNDYYTVEAYKTLKTNIGFCGKDKQVIAITSCTENEGKSVISINTAVSLAESGNRVLCIDGDLRKSALIGTIVKDGKVEKGLSHYLSRQASLDQVMCSTDVRGLDIIFSGPVPPNPAELLGSKLFGNMIDQMRKNYDYIIIDNAPLGQVIDAAVVAQNCDGAVLVVEQGKVSYKFAQDVKEQIEASGCMLLGVILNKVDVQAGNGYYGKYAKYGKYSKYE